MAVFVGQICKACQRASAHTISTATSTTQVAPTILRALGLDPELLQSVVTEHTAVLPATAGEKNSALLPPAGFFEARSSCGEGQ
jgi:hypothetical protein